MMQKPQTDACVEEYLGSDDRLRIFAARPFTFKARYYWNVVSAFCDGSITLQSCWSALRLSYVGLEHKTGRGIVLVCPEAISIMFELAGKNMNHQPHRHASDEYRNRVDAALKALGLSNFTHSESLIVDDWSCLDFPAEACAQSIAIDRATQAAT